MSDALQTNETGGQVDQMVRARIFWYGHVHEGSPAFLATPPSSLLTAHPTLGLTNGLKGKKLILYVVDPGRCPLGIFLTLHSLPATKMMWMPSSRPSPSVIITLR